MKVKIISLTTPLVEGIKTCEDLIVHNARVSNPKNQLNTDTNEKLIAYCVKNKHWSIFEQVFMGVEIKTSRAVSAQIIRHKSFNFQEFSQRYAEVTELESLQWRLQGETNRQVGDKELLLSEDLKNKVNNLQSMATETYKDLIKNGVAKECARMVLPMNTQTTIYMTGSVRSWIHYLDVRTSEHTQKEHRDIAIEIQEIFKSVFPTISKALNYE